MKDVTRFHIMQIQCSTGSALFRLCTLILHLSVSQEEARKRKAAESKLQEEAAKRAAAESKLSAAEMKKGDAEARAKEAEIRRVEVEKQLKAEQVRVYEYYPCQGLEGNIWNDCCS